MFTSKPRSHSQSYPPTEPSRASDLYLLSPTSGNISGEPTATPRPFSEAYNSELFRQDVAPSAYSATRDVLYDSGGDGLDNTFDQSFDRRNAISITSHIPHHRAVPDLQLPRDVLSSFPSLKRGDLPVPVDSSQQPLSFPSESGSVRAAASENSGESSSLSPQQESMHDIPRSRKTRREKPHINLAPDQPPTTQGKPRARVYVACLQCRTRKIRCDGAKPICHNCGRRANGNNECNYDPVPKRRGPDKTPGARQRMARDARNKIENGVLSARRRRRRTSDSSAHTTLSKQVSEPAQKPRNENSTSVHLSSPLSPITSCSPHDFTSIPNYLRSSLIPDNDSNDLASFPDANNMMDNQNSPPISPYDDPTGFSANAPYRANTQQSYITELDEYGNESLDEYGNESQDSPTAEIISEPSLNFTRKIWWDSLLSLYISPDTSHLQVLTSAQRLAAAQGITSDLRFLFRASNYWFSFFHIPSFFGNFCDPVKRESIQPSLILAMLSMATFWQSSEVGLGRHGRERALLYRDEAQSALEASFNAGWIDETLVQAAWLLALFEVCAHPRHSSQRSASSMVMLDSIIQSLSLTFVDADDPNATMFSPGTVPVVPPPSDHPRAMWFPDQPSTLRHFSTFGSDALHPPSPVQLGSEPGCSCNSITLAENWPLFAEHAPLWGATPAWNDSWSEAEIRKESCRRLCWSSVILAAGRISYMSVSQSQILDLFISEPANYALLFSGESIARSPILSNSHSSKNTIWALHDRSFLLWHGCIRMRTNRRATDTDKAHFAVKAWLEADALETALNKHTCAIERAFIFQAREYIFNTRMCISYEFQRYIPLVTSNMNGLFHRSKAEEWLSHQAVVAERFMHGLHTITGNSNNLLARRPFFVFWFMGQISRALSLWQCDNTLIVALDLCKALLPAIDYLTALWPCPEQRYRYESLRERLDRSCYAAGVPTPPPANLTLPAPSPRR